MSTGIAHLEVTNSASQARSGGDPEALVRSYGAAKSRQDVGAALRCCTDDFVLATTAWGTEARGRREAAFDLGVFFELFPDYEFAFESIVARGDRVVAVGRARWTWTGRLPSFVTGHRVLRRRARAVEVPAVAVFEVRDGLLARERFVFDGAAVSRQMGVPSWLMSRVMRRVAKERHRVTGGGGVAPVESERAILIRADAERVYDRAIGDVTALLHSVPPVPWLRPTRVELVGDRVVQGSQRKVTLRGGKVTHELVYDCVPGQHLRYRILDGWGRAIDWLVSQTHGVHWVERFEGHTRLAWRGHAIPRTWWLRPVVRLLMSLLVGTMQDRYLRAMKHELEAGVCQPEGVSSRSSSQPCRAPANASA